ARDEAGLAAGLAEKPAGRRTRERVERGRVADVRADRAGTVRGDDLAHARRDAVDRLVPRNALEAAVRLARLREGQAIGIAVDLEPRQALVAREAVRHRMLAVGTQRLELAF